VEAAKPIGTGVGGRVGAGAGDNNRERVIVEQCEWPMVRERTCVTNAAGTAVCEETQR